MKPSPENRFFSQRDGGGGSGPENPKLKKAKKRVKNTFVLAYGNGADAKLAAINTTQKLADEFDIAEGVFNALPEDERRRRLRAINTRR